jgi:hypothetical protein
VGFRSIWHNQLIIQNETSTRFRPHTLVTSVTLKGLGEHGPSAKVSAISINV